MDSLGDNHRADAELTAPGPVVGDRRHRSSARLGESPKCRAGAGATETPHRIAASLESLVATERRLARCAPGGLPTTSSQAWLVVGHDEPPLICKRLE